MRTKFLIILSIISIPPILMADQISLTDGRVYDGAIINADEQYINIQIDDSTGKIGFS